MLEMWWQLVIKSKDFVLHAGGSVWALDWCPRVHEEFDYPIKCEYLAVAAHPPDSSYHKMGAPLTGRGIVQIWCLLSMDGKDESHSKWPRVRPRKRQGRRGDLAGSNEESKFHPPGPGGRHRKRPLITEPPEDANGVLNSPPLKKRGRPRKLPSVSESLNVIPPPKRHRGRPRKIPDKKETIDDTNVGEESGTPRVIPALAVDDTHVKNKSPLTCPRGRPRKASNETEKVDALHAVKDLSNSEIISYTALDDSNAKSTLVSCKHRGRPKKKPGTMENVDVEVVEDSIAEFTNDLEVVQDSVAEFTHNHAVENFNLKTKSSPSRRPRGRPKKKPDKVTGVDELHIVQDLRMMEFAPAQSINDSNITSADEPRMVQDLSITAFVPAQSICDTDIGNKSSLPKRRRGRPKKILDESLSDINGENPKSPVQRGSAPDVNDTVVSGIPKQADLRKDEPHMVQDLSITAFVPAQSICDTDIGNKSSLPKRRRGRPKKRLDESLSDINGQNPKSPVQRGSAPDVNDTVISGIAKQADLRKDEPRMVHDLSITAFVPAQSVCDTDIGNKSSLPKRRRGRPKKRLDESLSEINGQNPKSPVQRGSAPDVNDTVVSGIAKQADLRKEAYDLQKIDDTVNTSDNVIRGCHMEGRVSTTNNADLCTQRSPNLRAANDSSSTHPILSTKDMKSVGSHVQDALDSNHDVAQGRLLDDKNVNLSLQKVVALPRIVLCLGHNGKVAWDVKWRPHKDSDVNFKHRMGYLAVLLGNGALEVWEVPCPRIVKNLYKSSFKEGTDPRFLKLRPVFRCSKLKFADRQSIPLTMEWSRAAPSDLIVVGCHDGTVALWKFSAEGSAQEMRPLLCFTADDVPIRAVAWAPGERDSESANLIVTAGHEGLKFWDIRDPYRPLWDFNPAQRIILSLDWLQHPSCLILTFDDGTMKTLSLSKAASDVPIAGKPFDGSRHGVVHNYYRSQFAIWSVQVSPITGVAAYCCADGSTLCFQITAKSTDKSRYRSPHFLCGTLMEVENSLTVGTPMPCTSVEDLPRPVRGLPSHSKCTPSQDPQVQGDDLTKNLGYRHSKVPASRKKTSRTRKSEKLLDENQSINTLNMVGEETGEDLKIEVMDTGPSNQNFLVLPPKIVALHRVRWNINRGSTRWLCYGGAAGIIRCQEIGFPSDV